MDTDLDTLATALYVRVDDLLKANPEHAPVRPAVGIEPKISDAELVTLAVMQALLGYVSEARWLRHATTHLTHLFPYLPKQPGYNKRLRKLAPTINWLVRALGRDTSAWADDVWVVDSTPVECGRSREVARRSELAGWAEYGYCASHSRFFWGLVVVLLQRPNLRLQVPNLRQLLGRGTSPLPGVDLRASNLGRFTHRSLREVTGCSSATSLRRVGFNWDGAARRGERRAPRGSRCPAAEACPSPRQCRSAASVSTPRHRGSPRPRVPRDLGHPGRDRSGRDRGACRSA